MEAGFGDFAVVSDADLGKERLVHQALAEVAGGEVGLQWLGGERQRLVKGFADVAELGFGSRDELGEGLVFSLDALGVALHDSERDGPGVVQLEQFGLLVFEGLQTSPVASGALADDLGLIAGDGHDVVSDALEFRGCHAESPVEGGYLDLHGLDLVVAAVAATAVARSAADAAEVLVLPAVAAVLAVDHLLAALVADDAALEVVLVAAGSFSGGALGLEAVLDAVEGLLVDELRVASVDARAHVDHSADVVGVAQHLVEPGP